MISEDLQEQATLYALGLLDANEAAAVEAEMAANPALRELIWELRDTAASLSEAAGDHYASPPAHLKRQILQQIVSDPLPAIPPTPGSALENKIVRPRFGWVPWAIAAGLFGSTLLLVLDRTALLKEAAETRRLTVQPLPGTAGILSRVAFCELEPTPDAPVKPRAAVLWDPARHEGVLRVTRLANPDAGKDYQLWVVEHGRKDPVNAGVVHLDPEGHAEIAFKPDPIPGDNQVVALALSLEKAGGSSTNQGPILFLGKL